MEQFIYKVKKEEALLAFLKNKTLFSGREVKRLLERGACRLNGRVEKFGSVKLRVGDRVTFRAMKAKEKSWMSPLYQDPFLTFFNKPSGLISDPEKGHFLVHRLDKGTSGVLLMARTLFMQRALEALFKKREVKKVYIALIKGTPQKEEGTLESKLGKKGSFHGQTLYGASPSGRLAMTHYKVLEKRKGMSLIELHPETGRTHQLRVHLSEFGHPILGDLQYGRGVAYPKIIDRLCLHAYRLSFIHPETGRKVQVTAPLPELFGYKGSPS